jgi:hypothetical protein
LRSDHYEQARSVLESLYGQTDGSSEEIASWQRGSEVLRLERRAPPRRASLVLAERSFLSELLRERR